MNRRSFLKGSGMAAAACAVGRADDGIGAPERKGNRFTFAFFTDVHIEPEMDAPLGTSLAIDVINASDADFAICGGDHVFDALAAHKDRVLEQYALYTETESQLRIPVRHVLGNHDVVGLQTSMSSHDVLYGKALFEKTFNTRTYYSFAHKGVNFIVLDSILIDGRDWHPEIDAAQIAWLKRALEYGTDNPTIVVSHVPIATSIRSYCPGSDDSKYNPISNGEAIVPILEKYNVIALLQGHIHIVENVRHHGIQYITGGAVCGNWWQGTHFGDREGVTFVTVDGTDVSTKYVPTGFLTIDPDNT